MSSKITMNDMKRRATALLDFISRTQVELAGESLTDPAAGSDKPQDGPNGTALPVLTEPSDAASGKDFKELGCVEMMDSLTRRLVKWQQQYAV